MATQWKGRTSEIGIDRFPAAANLRRIVQTPIRVATAMHALYASEINCHIQSFWDGGWDRQL
jgi:hypothetical protein